MKSAALRRRFDRAAPGYEATAGLDAEVADRMLQRLDYVRVSPARVLDAGAGTGRDARALARRYPHASIIAVDHSAGMLKQVRRAAGFVERLRARFPLAVCADICRLPVRAEAVDLVWSNLALHWTADPAHALRELARVLNAGGLLMFSAYGPDTFIELGAPRPPGFLDMHDLGDLLVAGGLADPVMDMERITLTYADSRAFFADMRASAQSALVPAASRGLARRDRVAALASALDARRRDGRLAISLEIIYGHAWKPAQRRNAEGHAVISAGALRRMPR